MHNIYDNIFLNEVATDLYSVGYYFEDQNCDLVGPYASAELATEAACAYVLTLG